MACCLVETILLHAIHLSAIREQFVSQSIKNRHEMTLVRLLRLSFTAIYTLLYYKSFIVGETTLIV